MTLAEAKQKLAQYGQEHVLKYYKELDEAGQKALLTQIAETDMSILASCGHREELVKKGAITPLAAMELSEINANRESFTVTGLEAIRDGKVGAVLLAGGMGTRLGSDNPKCMYNVGINRELYIFECLVNNMMDVVRQSGSWFHLFVMTSEKNNDTTIQFMQEKKFFGYNPEFVHFFKQEMAAATDYEGKIYLEEKGRLATSPNGNGGWFISMKNAGLLELVKEEGIEWINVFAVDNVLQRIADPCFVGATIQRIKFTINWQAVLGSIMKMIMMPAVVLILGLLFHMDPLNLKMLVVSAALPPAFSGIIIADEYNTYVATGTSSLTLSVILFIGFCPLWIWLTDVALKMFA